MPPREKEFDAVVLVLDVGLTNSASGFLAKSINCASELLQRKLFSEANDRFGLVEVGADRTDNDLDYDNVAVLDRGLTVADWELLEYVQKHVKGTNNESDWLDGVVVALDFLKKKTAGTKVAAKKIVLLSDLGVPSSPDKLDLIVKGMESEGIEFTFIGPEWTQVDDNEDDGEGSGVDGAAAGPSNGNGGDDGSSGDGKKPKTAEQKASESMLRQLVVATDGVMCPIEDAMAQFMFKDRRKKRPFPWKATLEIGSDVRIATVGYIQVRREAPKTWKKTLAKRGKGDDVEELKAETTFVRNNEDEETVGHEDLVESYKYGSDAVPVTEEDKENFKYSGGPKNLSVLGFVNQDDISRQHVIGDGCMVFQPVDGDDNSATALAALAQALHELRRCALVRKVYRANSTPRLGVLIPEYVADDDGNDQLRLVFMELPYNEDLRNFTFAPVQNDSVKPSKEQLSAVDDLIDAMMLGEGGEDGPDVEPDSIVNPTYQHLFHCLASRAIRPGQVLPDVPEHIRALMLPPQSGDDALEKALDQVDSRFNLEEVAKKKEKVTGAQAFSDGNRKREAEDDDEAGPSKKTNDGNDDLSLARKSAVAEVGSATPVEDFKQLLADGEALIPVGQQLERVIVKLIEKSFGGGLFEKILSCLREYRAACIECNNPHLYNDFLYELKHDISRLGREELWLEVAESNVGLVSKSEHGDSKVESAEAMEFLLASKGSGEKEEEKKPEVKEEEEEEDMLDDL